MHPEELNQYMVRGTEAKYGPAKDFPRRKVTTEEFVRLLMATGATEEKARFQATVSKGLGSSALVGKEWLEIDDAAVLPQEAQP